MNTRKPERISTKLPPNTHKFDGIYASIPGTGGSQQIRLICTECGMQIPEPRYSMNREGETVCGSLWERPKTCEEFIVEFVHTS